MSWIHVMELLVEIHNFNQWWKTYFMCDECKATNPACINGAGEFSYMDFTYNAGWRDTLISNRTYVAEYAATLSPFMQIEGHIKELCWRDWAHLDPLGFGRDLGGALLKSMHLRNEMGEGSVADQLRRIKGEMNEYRKKNGRKRIPGSLTPANTGLDNMSAWIQFQ